MDGLIFENTETLQNFNKNFCVRANFPVQRCSIILQKRQTHSDIAEYLHTTCYGPVQSTFLKAIEKGFFKSWPALTKKLFTKHLPPVMATAKGHLMQTRQHLQSTTRPTIPDTTHLQHI